MKKNSSLNTAQSPEILIFKITAIAPSVDFHGKRVFSFFKIFCNIKFSRHLAVFTVTDKLFIYPYIKCRAYCSKMKKYLFIFPVGRNSKFSFI